MNYLAEIQYIFPILESWAEEVFWYAYGASLLGTFSTDPQSRMEYQNQKQIWSRRSIFSLSLSIYVRRKLKVVRGVWIVN